MNAPSSWIDSLVARCSQLSDTEQISRELYNISVRYGEPAFETLVKAICADVRYFMAKCREGESILSLKDNTPEREFFVKARVPHNSKVTIRLVDDRIDYEQRIRENPRREPDVQTGYMLVRCDFDRSLWLEHHGHRIDFEEASRFLVEGLLRSTLNR